MYHEVKRHKALSHFHVVYLCRLFCCDLLPKFTSFICQFVERYEEAKAFKLHIPIALTPPFRFGLTP